MSNTISANLSAQLQQLSELANNEKLSTEEKKAALQTAGAKTLAEINVEMPSLNFTSTKFAEKIAKLITDGKFNLLPFPAKMSTDLQALRLVATALSDNVNSMSVDISTINRFLAEAHRSLAITNSNLFLLNRVKKLEASEKEFSAKEDANKKQLTADLLSASAEGVMGVVQLAGATISFKGALKNIVKSKDVLKETHTLNNLSETKKIAKQELVAAAEDLKSVKTIAEPRIKQLSDKVKAGTASFTEENEMKSLEMKLSKCEKTFTAAQTKFEKAEFNENLLTQNIDTKNLNLKSSTQKYEGVQQIMNSSATVLKGIVQTIAAVYTFQASKSRVDADRLGLEKDMASQSEQSAQEGYRNMMEGARNTVQSLSAMEQSISSSMTNIARA